jgi:uncharacterized lipoprotein
MSNIEIYKKSLIALLLAFLVTATLSACSSSDEAEEEDAQSEICDEMGANQSGGCL